MIEIPDINTFIAENAALATILLAIMGLVKRRVKTQSVRLITAASISGIIGVVYVACTAYSAGVQMSIAVIATYSGQILASSMAIFGMAMLAIDGVNKVRKNDGGTS